MTTEKRLRVSFKPELIQALRRAYETADVRFVDDGDRVGAIGPRLNTVTDYPGGDG